MVLVFKELKMGWCLLHHTWNGCVMLICFGGERKARRLGRLLSDRVWDVMGREAGFQQLQGQREGDDGGDTASQFPGCRVTENLGGSGRGS